MKWENGGGGGFLIHAEWNSSHTVVRSWILKMSMDRKDI
jgi:hypothetical protein